MSLIACTPATVRIARRVDGGPAATALSGPKIAFRTLGQDEPEDSNWAAAAKVIHNWEATGKIGEEPPDIPTIRKPSKRTSMARRRAFGRGNGAQASRAPRRQTAAVCEAGGYSI